MRFGRRLMLSYAAAMALSLLLTAAATYWGAISYFRSSMQQRLDNNAVRFERLVGAAGTVLEGRRRPLPVTSPAPAENVLPLLAEVRASDGRIVERSPALSGADLPPAPPGARLALVPFRGSRWAVAAWPFAVGASVYQLELAGSWDATEANLASLRRLLLLVAGAGLLLGLVGGEVLSRTAAADVDAIRRAAEEIGATDLSKRLPLQGTGDELDRMAKSFNDLLARVEEAYGRQALFVAEASHELRTPTTIIRGVSEMLMRWGAARPEVLSDSLDTIHRQSEHLSRLVDDLLVLARGDLAETAPREPVELGALAAQAISDASWRARGRQLVVEPREAAVVDGDPVRLRQMVDALLDNALRFTAEGGHVRVGVSTSGSEVRLEVEDDGPGFRPADLPRVFDRFFRGEAQPAGRRGGVGLGLAIAQAIALGHGGTIEAGNAPAGGALVWVRLPLAPPAPGGGEETSRP